MIVVCDTSPVNYLVLIGEIDLLPQLFTTVVLPVGVLAELQHPRTPPQVASWACELPPSVQVIAPEPRGRPPGGLTLPPVKCVLRGNKLSCAQKPERLCKRLTRGGSARKWWRSCHGLAMLFC